MHKLKIGITGGIGCGQSLVARMLQEKYGAVVISMDQAGRAAVDQHDKVRAQLRQAFGNEYFDHNGQLIRPKLAEFIFSDAEARQQLNRIIHPVMLHIFWEELSSALKRPSPTPYIVVDAALLFELEIETQMDKVVVVTAPLAQRLQRIMARNGLSLPQAQQRIAAQWPVEEKVRRADYVIENNRTIAMLARKVSRLHHWICGGFSQRGIKC